MPGGSTLCCGSLRAWEEGHTLRRRKGPECLVEAAGVVLKCPPGPSFWRPLLGLARPDQGLCCSGVLP